MKTLAQLLGWSVVAAVLWFAVLEPLAHEREHREFAKARANQAASAEMERQEAALATEFEAAMREGAAESARERELRAVTDPELRANLEALHAWPASVGLVERPALDARAAVGATRFRPYVSERWRLARYRSGEERGGTTDQAQAWAVLTTEQHVVEFETALACAKRGSFWTLRRSEWSAHEAGLRNAFARTWFEAWASGSDGDSLCIVFYAPYEIAPAIAELQERRKAFQKPRERALTSR
ncbi:MAG: hypothetical protein JNM84_21195 [Planctomycetes bacterium]|nr:hypothetical protein [Planctomycetota bacterium]